MQFDQFSREFDDVANKAAAALVAGDRTRAVRIVNTTGLSRDPPFIGHLFDVASAKAEAFRWVNGE